jgi:RNA polymerase sigma factor (sigma-70 family)
MEREEAGQPPKRRKPGLILPDVTRVDADSSGPVASIKSILDEVKAFALRQTRGDHDAADDASSKIAMKVWLRRKTDPLYAGDVSRLSAFANTASQNELRTQLRRKRTRADAAPHVAEEMATYQSSRDDPEKRLERREFWTLVARALMSLPEDYRAVWIMRHLGDMSNPEIAEKLGEEIGAISTRVSRAGDKMKAYFELHLNDNNPEKQS